MSYIDIHDMPGGQRDHVVVPLQAAGLTPWDCAIWRAPFDCRIRSVVIVWSATLAGTGVNYFTTTVYDRGTAGTDTTVLETRAWTAAYQGWVGNYLAEYTAGSYHELDEGSVLSLTVTQIAAGAAFPAAAVYVLYEGR